MKLRDYQQIAVNAVEAGWQHAERQLGVAATGAGKTIMFSHLAARQEGRTLILAHREELIEQAVTKLHAATGIFAGVERASQRAMPGHGVIVASVQSMRRRLAKYRPDAFDLIICDEAHHALSPEWRAVLSHFTGCRRVLGVTATPDRADKKSLGKYFQRVAFEVTLLDLIQQGYLAPLRAKRLAVEVDMSALIKTRREISADEAAEAMHPRLVALAREVAEEVWDRKTLVFLPRCDVSEKFADLLSEYGVASRHVSGASVDRAECLEWFAQPGPRALCNAMLLTEGYDEPSVDAICCLRPTKSRSLYSQIVGRGTRLSPGKDHCLILDPLWLTGEHSLCRPACLTGGNDLHREKLQEQLDLGLDLLEAETVAKVNVEEALARQLAAAAKKRKVPRGMVDPLAYALALHDGALAEYEPTMEWESAPAGDATMRVLADMGLWTDGMTAGYAAALLERIEERRRLGLASPKQVMLLRRMGEANAETMTQTQAGYALSKRIGRRAA